MRASPACQVELQRFGAWRAALTLLFGAGAMSVVAWLAIRSEAPPWLLVVAATAMVLILGAVALPLWRIHPSRLRWDGQIWQLDGAPGRLDAALDLGPWMLLRFIAEEADAPTWLPVQRRGLEGQWHALRCAVYSPRPTDPR